MSRQLTTVDEKSLNHSLVAISNGLQVDLLSQTNSPTTSEVQIMIQSEIATSETSSDDWYHQLARQSAYSKGLAIGLISGFRSQNDPRCIYRIASKLVGSMSDQGLRSDLLVCRLDVEVSILGKWGATVDETIEQSIEKSALGDWDEINVSMVIGNSAPIVLQQILRWLPKWKLRYGIILIDLGPIHLVPSRTVGRLCDSNFIVLGPNSSASAQWIMQYVDYHTYCGSHIEGTLVTSFAA